MVYIIAIIVWGLDRLTKFLIVTNFSLRESRSVLGNLISFTYVHNEGAAFSILQGKRIFFILTTIILIAIILYMYYTVLPKTLITTIIIGTVLGGALGNFYDRLRFGYVIDFIDFHFFPIFNVADIAVVCGTLLLAWQLWIIPEGGK
ncbi:signal peptidase II [Clostridium sp. 'deep sea']|uniref:signal peptidase II n=1 Tax=Clostridium sp. 'deep sea' TaxID=2779445 RepID=UPI00189682D3|nr:signal peptidase II [Clostridium sp. 'deep sea']QOR36203.1 signal peptidase II [Clostridium sp. 'deep sea']